MTFVIERDSSTCSWLYLCVGQLIDPLNCLPVLFLR
ncbi:hypothetical protein M6B38_311900 [Iris pallida]|uniref:Uncharacterized protein n=1 Tax=Iris pallida TaxID=29817 RepID=A0AAX6HFQ1_IRIPA|nr:hypothetical protein M6B38_311900 [Iris pallida]